MIRHLWSITAGTFIPRCASGEAMDQIITSHSNAVLADNIITDHIDRSTVDRLRIDYVVTDYGDEMKIHLTSPVARRRLLVNLQYEGLTD